MAITDKNTNLNTNKNLNLSIIHLRAKIHRIYKFQKFKLLIILIILIILTFSILLLNVFFYNRISLNFNNNNDNNIDILIDNSNLGKTFYEKMLDDYKDEISSSEDLQIKIMNDIIKDSINYKNNKIKLNTEIRKKKISDLKIKNKKKIKDKIKKQNEINLKNIQLKKQKQYQQNEEDQNLLNSQLLIDELDLNNNNNNNNLKHQIHKHQIKQSQDLSPSVIFIPDTKLAPIKRLFANILPILIECEPKIGYQLRNEKNIEIKNKKFRLSKKIIPRTYGKNGIINIAIHDINDNFPILSKDYLSESLYLPNDMFEELKKSHDFFVSNIPNFYSDNTYNGNGIVFIGGGKFSWLTLLSIENIRSTGSKLPIEVMIPQFEDYESQLCEIFLPKLNAKCLLLYEIFPDIINTNNNNNKSFKLTGYQYKSLSLLASTFEKVLFLDSDNIAVRNPDNLFNSEPFNSYGMILWPDFWKRVTHPLFYDLAGFNITNNRVRYLLDKVTPFKSFPSNLNFDSNLEIPLHDLDGSIPDLSSESGQIIVNKKTHFKSLLLSFYYNVYGPRHYYPLFSQGGNGEGDKETFIASTIYYKLPVYQMNKPVGVIGHWEDNDNNRNYEGVGMIQYDPITDKINQDNYEKFILNKIKIEGLNFNYNKFEFLNYLHNANSNPMFIHCNYPKLDPISLFNDNKLFNSINDKPWRLYSDQPNIGFDFELKQWNLINKYFCSIDQPLNLNYLNNYLDDSNFSIQNLCLNIKNRLIFLENNPLPEILD
ncbi:hypothetical protein C6P40_000060 [Pichia californica]|uniref:Alpha-1,2-mannosyltransferase n=1 Tax=Pichia californica TaxID=460514 RepID=A0A9P7BIM4_9ASCO|nr:hypothetical protein C6P40_000060 [[Candida] californica]